MLNRIYTYPKNSGNRGRYDQKNHSSSGTMEVDGAGEGRGSGTDTGRSGSGDETSAPFVNHRLAAWERQRADWTAAGRAGRAGGDGGRKKPRRPVLSADATYDDLLTSSRPFVRPVPLTEMVDFLVEVWEEDGLYD